MQWRRGFSLLELLVVAAVFVTALVSIIGVSPFVVRAVARAADRTQAAFLLEEGVEAVRYIRDASWKNSIRPRALGEPYCLDFSADKKRFYLNNPRENKLLLRLNEASGSTSFADESGQGNNASCTTCPTLGQASASVDHGSAAQFTGTQSLTVSNQSAFNFASSQPFTLSVWVSFTDTAAIKEILSKYVLSFGTFGYRLALLGDERVEFSLRHGSTGVVVQTAAPVLAGWRHIAVTYNGEGNANGVVIYVDGEAVPLASAVLNNLSGAAQSGQPLVIAGSTNRFNGYMDEVMVFARMLSNAEVRDLFNAGSVCKKVDSKFARSVTFENACRSLEKDIIGHTTSETGACLGSGTVDNDTKYVNMQINWQNAVQNPPINYAEAIEMYITNIFREPS